MKVTDRLAGWEKIVYLTILVLALFTRFYMLGDRAMSHDESIHTKYAWNLYAGDGFQHNPMMHGPLLFEGTAVSYLFLGAGDFSSRIFTAVVGVALVLTPILFRRWLSRTGAVATSLFLLISPSISYYSRYIRHDVLLLLSAVLLLWIILEFLRTGRASWLSWLAAAFSVMYATKEAAYIYTAIFGMLLFLPFAVQVISAPWQRSKLYTIFLGVLSLTVVMVLIFTISFRVAQVSELALDEEGNSRVTTVSIPVWGRVAAALAFAALFAALVLIYYGIGEEMMRQIRLFDVLMVIGTLTLPLGSAFLIKFVAGADMEVVYEAVRTGNFSLVPTPTVVALFGVTLAAIVVSVALGLWWDAKRWPRIALIHYTIFIVLYTTIFTWGFGALSGLVGSLAYWLAQQQVRRGNQPGFYYALVGSLYEYLAILLSLGGGIAAIVQAVRAWGRPRSDGATDRQVMGLSLRRLFPLFLLGWTALSWIAYTLAGEKMPWLLVHIALPSIFMAGWGLGRLVDRLATKHVNWRAWIAFGLALPLLVAALVVLVGSFTAAREALQVGVSAAGLNLDQLRSIGGAFGGLLGFIASVALLAWSVRQLGAGLSLRLGALLFVVLLTGLTVRTMVMLNFINYDLATEFLVYAHGTPDIKIALERIRDVSWEVTGTPHNVQVAYSEDGSWPFTWYMVEFPNNYFYSTKPDPQKLLESPVVIAGRPQYEVVEEIVGDTYVTFDYTYLWWPIQDYFSLSWESIRQGLVKPELRAAIWDIVWRRDYRRYARYKNQETPFTFESWPYRKDFRLYVRGEIAEQVWPYERPSGVARFVSPEATQVPDPYAAGPRTLSETRRVALPGAVTRGFDSTADGLLYVADTANHRIWRVSPDGQIEAFGEFGAGPGQFNEPWDVAIDDEGNIYVADTWNHRIQKFDSSHQFITSWGTLVQVVDTGDPAAQGFFYGPRSLAVSPVQELYVADTGNKRIQVFDLSGGFLREFGGGGVGAGRLDEPVGVDINAEGVVAVADTWNSRVQLFTEEGLPIRQWTVSSWDIENPDEKPFLAWGAEGLYVTDPMGRRVLAFDALGAFRWALSADAGANLAFAQSVLVIDGTLMVGDAHRGELVVYELP